MAVFSIKKTIVAGFVLALALICFFAVYTYVNMQKAETDNRQVEATLKSLRVIESLFDNAQEIETGQRGYIISGNQHFLEPYFKGLQQMTRDTIALKTLPVQSKERKNDTELLLDLVRRKIAFSSTTIRVRDEKGINAAELRVQSAEGKKLMDSIRLVVQKIENEDRDMLNKYSDHRRVVAKATTQLFFILAGSFFLFLVLFFLWMRRDVRKRLGAELSARVEENTLTFRDILDRISDGFMALDKNWNFVYLNNTSAAISGRHDLLGKNIWEEFPDGVGNEFYHAYHRAMETQEYIHLEAYYPGFDAWFESHIYPSPYGLSIHSRDITEKKKTESKLQQAVERFDMVASATNDVLWEADLQKKTTWWNDNFYERFGYDKKEDFTAGDSWEKLLHPDDRKRVVDNINFVLTNTPNTSWIDEYRFRKADGSYADIYDRCYIMRDATGKAYKVIGSMTDISMLQQTREKLRITEDRYRIMVEEASDAIFINDAEGYLQDVNDRACEMLGYSEQELCNMNVGDLIPHAELSARPVMYTELLSGQRTSLERNMQRRDGTLVPVDITARMLSDGRIIAIVRDITERKKAEQQLAASEKSLRQILSGTAETFYVIDRNYRITLINKAAEAKLGKAWGQPVTIGTNIIEMIPADELKQARESIEKVFAGEKVEYELHLTGNDLPSWVVVNFLPVYDDDGVITGAYISSKDISAKKNAEIILKDSEEKRRLIMNAALDAIVSIDASGAIIFWNPQSEKIFGWQEQEVSGKSLAETIIPERYRESHRHGMARYLRTGEGPVINRLLELTAINRSGQEFPIELSIIPVVQEGVTTFTAFIRDITERKKVAEKLRLSVERFETISSATHDAIWEWNLETGELWANDEHQRLYGLTKADPVPVSEEWQKRIHPDDRHKTVLAQEMALQSGINYWESEYRFQKSNNEFVILFDRCYIIRNKEGKPVRLTGSMIDITQRKKAEEELRQSEQKYKLLFNNNPLPLWMATIPDLDIVDVNESAIRQYGYSREEFIKLNARDLRPEEDVEFFVSEVSKMKPGINNTRTWRHKKKDGTIINVEIFSHEIMYEGRRVWLGLSNDITEKVRVEEALRASEKKYKLLFENNPMPMWMLGLDAYNIIDVNESAIRHYGYSREEFLKMHAQDLHLPENIAYLNELAKRKISGVRFSDVLKHKKKDGTLIDAEVISHDVDYDGKPARLILSNDVTEKRRAEQMLKKSFEDIRKLTEHIQKIREEERAHIAREIHDELGQQLTVLKMDVSWLNKKIQADDAIKEKLKDLTIMLDGTVRTVRRISSELRPSLLDDLGLIAAIDWHLKEFEKRTGILTEFEEPDPGLVISGSISTGLFRIFQESLTNVTRHAEAERVKVSLQQTDNSIVLKIQDDGKGFDKEKVANKRTLGILGMKERTEMMGGQYAINSEPGQGTTVIVSIPANEQSVQG